MDAPRQDLREAITKLRDPAAGLAAGALFGWMCSMFGFVTLLLAVDDTCVALTYSVAQKAQKTGVRSAPGAGRRGDSVSIRRQVAGLPGYLSARCAAAVDSIAAWRVEP